MRANQAVRRLRTVSPGNRALRQAANSHADHGSQHDALRRSCSQAQPANLVCTRTRGSQMIQNEARQDIKMLMLARQTRDITRRLARASRSRKTAIL